MPARAFRHALLLSGLLSVTLAPVAAQRPARAVPAPAPQLVEVFEQSIVDLAAAQAAGTVTSRQLVDAYLARIAAYDQSGPRLNAIVALNPHAREDAEALDKERAAKGPRGPLHGIPVLLKDNYGTTDLPTAAGTLALSQFRPSADAFQVKKLREAGAVILGKTTMHELAAGITTISSLTGQTRNPYDLTRVPGGSSGGAGAAIGASFAAAGMGSDTCGSIRIPAGNQSLVGLRVTSGLSSRAGIVPLSVTQDVAGPLARTVTDLAIMLDATVGPDPDDASTAGAAAHVPRSYRDGLKADGLKGARIGVLSSYFGTAPEDEEVATIVRKAIDGMKAQGAEIVEVSVPGLDDLLRDGSVIGDEFKFDLAEYLSHQPTAPVKSLGEIMDRGLYHDQLDATFRLRVAPEVRETEHYRQALIKRRALRDAVLATFESRHLDAMAYPTLRRKPVMIGETQPGATCQLSASTGLPAIAMPAGFTTDGLPIAVELLGAAFAEPRLLTLAYGWEQAAHTRRPPFSTPPLVRGAAPAPFAGDISVGGGAEPTVRIRYTYDSTTATLKYDAVTSGLAANTIIALTLQRGEAEKPGPILAHLLAPGQASGSATIAFRGRDRDDLVGGRVYVHVYTKTSPLGAGRARLPVS